MGLFAPSPVVRPEFVRSTSSSQSELPPTSPRESFNRKSFDSARSRLDVSTTKEKCWTWSLKHDLLPQPQIQYMISHLQPATPFRRSLPTSITSKEDAATRLAQRNSSPRIPPRVGSIGCTKKSIPVIKPMSKRSSDVPSLVSDGSHSSLDGSDECPTSPKHTSSKISFSRPFVNGKPPQFLNPCDALANQSPRLHPVRKSYERSRALIPGSFTPESTQNVDSEQHLNLMDTRFDFEKTHPMASQSINADSVLPQAVKPHADGHLVSVSAPGSRSVSPNYPMCRHISKYMKKPLPPLPPNANTTGSPQRSAQKMCNPRRLRPRSGSVQSSASASSASSVEIVPSYNLFPAPPRTFTKMPVVYKTRRAVPTTHCRIVDSEDSSSGSSFNDSETSSFSQSISPNTSFESDAAAKSDPGEPAQLRETYLEQDLSYVLSLFPSPPTTVTL